MEGRSEAQAEPQLTSQIAEIFFDGYLIGQDEKVPLNLEWSALPG
jgi:hypothetical protein